jgi:hypothetical protein
MPTASFQPLARSVAGMVTMATASHRIPFCSVLPAVPNTEGQHVKSRQLLRHQQRLELPQSQHVAFPTARVRFHHLDEGHAPALERGVQWLASPPAPRVSPPFHTVCLLPLPTPP